MAKTYFVYILFNKNRRLYIGVTSNLAKRLYEHKHHLVDGFTKNYNIDQLAYCETGHDALGAIQREKVLKSWRREKKVALIERTNPKWCDLAEDWMGSEFSVGQPRHPEASLAESSPGGIAPFPSPSRFLRDPTAKRPSEWRGARGVISL